MDKLSEEIVRSATLKGIHIGFAESLTGGLISAEIVNVPGASAVLEGSIVSYSNEVKTNVLGVDPEVIKSVGAVSEECAKQMAEGARKVLGADRTVSVTGIAGPGGGSPEKPVGTVYIGVSTPESNYARKVLFEGNREEIRDLTAAEALKMLKEVL